MTETDQNLIKKYVNDTLSGQELENFVYKLKRDPDLQKAVENYRINGHSEEKAQKEPSKDDAISEEKMGKTATILMGIALTASLFFLAFSAIYWHAYYNYNNDVLLTEYTYAPFEQQLLNDLESNPPDELVLQKIVMTHQLFKSNNYFAAIPLFDELILKLSKYPVLGEDGSKYVIENAQWNRVVAYLNINDDKNKEKLKTYISEIVSNPDHRYRQQAYKLATLINSFMYDLADAD